MSTDGAQTDGPVAGWYPDPHEQADLRWFDGSAWTDQTRAHPTADDAEQSRSTSAGEQDEELDEELLALIAADDRRRRIIIGAAVVLLLLVVAWFVFLRGDDGAEDAATVTPPSASTDDGTSTDPSASGDAPEPLTPPSDDGTSNDATTVDAAQRIALESVARIVAGVETCAGESGSFAGCDAPGVIKVVPSLRPLLGKCGQPGGGCVRLIGSDGFEVKVQDASPQPRTWVEIHILGAGSDGANVTRTCEPAGCTPTGSWSPDDVTSG